MEDDGAPRKAIRAALRHRDFRLLVIAQTISGTGDWLYTVALIAYVLDRTHSPAWVGLASAIRFAPYIVFSTFGGLVADRYDRKKVMIAMDLGQGVVMIGLTIVAAADGAPIAAIGLAAACTSFAAFYVPSASASTPALVGEEDLVAANAISSTVASLALAVGPALGGLLLLLGSSTAAFAVNALTFFASAAFTVPIRTKLSVAREREDEPTHLRHHLGEGLRAMTSSPTVLVVVVVSVGYMFFYGLEIVLYPLASARLLGLGAHGIGFMFAAVGIGGILSAGAIGRVSRSDKQGLIMTMAVIVSGLPMVSLAFLRAPALAYLVLGVEGVAFVLGEVLSVTMLQRILDPVVLGRVMGIMDAVMVVAILAGSLLAPVMVHLGGLPNAMIISGALLVILGGLVLPRARELDRRLAAAAAELAPRVDVLRRLGIFEAASTRALEALATASTEIDVEGGTPVIREGAEPDDLYVVLAGSLRVSSFGEGTRERAIRVLKPGDYFGEIGLLRRIPRTATVTSVETCRLLQISGEDFLRIVNEGSPLTGILHAGVASRLARTHPSSDLGHA